MLQLFLRHVESVCFECFRCFIGMFHLCFSDVCCKCVYLDVAYVSHIHCMCFIWILCMVVMVFKCFRRFRCMLYLFHMDVAKVDQGMLHILQLFS